MCVSALTALSALAALDISRTAASDVAAPALAALTTLSRLSLACTACGAKTAAVLRALPRLRDLELCREHTHASLQWRGGGALGAAARDSGSGPGETCVGAQGVPAVLALASCPKLARLAILERTRAEARRLLDLQGAPIPLWLMSVTGPPIAHA
jgi:hypothetical protein